MGADLQFTLGLDGQQFVGTIRLANAGVAGLTSNMQRAFGGAAGGAGIGAMVAQSKGTTNAVAGLAVGLGKLVAGYFTVRAALSAFNSTLQKSEDLMALSERVGETRENALRLSSAFRLAGLDAGNAAPQLNIMQRSIAGVNEQGLPTKHIFDQIGLSIEDLQRLSPVQQFQKIAATISAIPNPAQRANAAMNIFGRSGGELLRIFNRPDAMAAFTAQLTLQQRVMLASAPAIENMAIQWKIFKANLATGFGGTTFMSEMRVLAMLLTALNHGSGGDFATSFVKGAGWVLDRLASTVMGLASVFAWGGMKIVEAGYQFMGILTNGMVKVPDELKKRIGIAEDDPTVGFKALFGKWAIPPKFGTVPNEKSTPGDPYDVEGADKGTGHHHRTPPLGNPTPLQQIGQFVAPTRAAYGMMAENLSPYERRALQSMRLYEKNTNELVKHVTTIAQVVQRAMTPSRAIQALAVYQ